MRISDWSSDLCSSDLLESGLQRVEHQVDLLLQGVDVIAVALHLAAVISRGLDGGDLYLDAVQILGILADCEHEVVRSEERSVGKGCVSPSSFRWSPVH